jgi:hypothetical protein
MVSQVPCNSYVPLNNKFGTDNNDNDDDDVLLIQVQVLVCLATGP